MSVRPKRRRAAIEPVDPRQQDLFAAEAPPLPPAAPAMFSAPLEKARIRRQERKVKAQPPASPQCKPPPPPFNADDDWWTTRSVCGFLKIGRKALWNMRRDAASDFPAPVDAVGHRHLYLAAEVRAWMDAQRDSARSRAQDRRQALAQFSSRSS